MTRDKAVQIVARCLEIYRQQSYSELLLKIGEQETFESLTDGKKFQVEIDFNIDDEITKNIRVTGMISYSLATDFSPVVSDFIISPNGNFIGE